MIESRLFALDDEEIVVIDAARTTQKKPKLGDPVGNTETEPLVKLRACFNVADEKTDMAKMRGRWSLIAADSPVKSRHSGRHRRDRHMASLRHLKRNR